MKRKRKRKTNRNKMWENIRQDDTEQDRIRQNKRKQNKTFSPRYLGVMISHGLDAKSVRSHIARCTNKSDENSMKKNAQ